MVHLFFFHIFAYKGGNYNEIYYNLFSTNNNNNINLHLIIILIYTVCIITF